MAIGLPPPPPLGWTHYILFRDRIQLDGFIRSLLRGEKAPKNRVKLRFQPNFRVRDFSTEPFRRSGPNSAWASERMVYVLCHTKFHPDRYVSSPTRAEEPSKKPPKTATRYTLNLSLGLLYPPLPRWWPNWAWKSGPMVNYLTQNLSMIGKYIGLMEPKIANFTILQNFAILQSSLTNQGHIWHACQISLELVYFIAKEGRKL